MTDAELAQGRSPPKLTAAHAAGVLLGLVVVLAAYVTTAHALGLIALFIGDLVLW